MTSAQLKMSLALWTRRLTYRRGKLAQARREAASGAGGATPGVITATEAARIRKWRSNVAEAERIVNRRRDQIAARRPKPKVSARAKALSEFARYIGVTERPAYSNGNSANISRWQARFGFGRVPYCGIAIAEMLSRAGVRGVTSRLASVALIEDDARAGRAPFGRGWTSARTGVLPGDLVVIGGRGVHVEMVEKVLAGGAVQTIGANTSPGRAGSQANGGGIWRRRRSAGEIRGFARVNFPGGG